MGKIKILITPNNVASMPTFLVEALNQYPEVEARGVFLGGSQYVYQSTDTCCRYFKDTTKKKPFQFLYHRLGFLLNYLNSIIWADVVHYVWDNPNVMGLDLWLLKRLKKKVFIEWVGSDVRIPEIAQEISRFAKAAYAHPDFEYKGSESYEISMQKQRKFAQVGAIPMVYPEIDLFVDTNLFPKRYFTNQRLQVKKHPAFFPSKDSKRPLIVHSPTAPILKGSPQIIEVLKELSKHYEFDFILLNNKPRQEVLEKIQACDIFIDQIVFGAHGLAFCEAMAYGKPTVCYIADKVLANQFPSDCPVINANPETLKEKLMPYLESAELRYETGKLSRQYAEKYHDASEVASHQLAVYKKELGISSI